MMNKRMTPLRLFDTNDKIIPPGEIASDVIFYYV